jgi:hypothetical protein
MLGEQSTDGTGNDPSGDPMRRDERSSILPADVRSPVRPEIPLHVEPGVRHPLPQVPLTDPEPSRESTPAMNTRTKSIIGALVALIALGAKALIPELDVPGDWGSWIITVAALFGGTLLPQPGSKKE